MHTKTRTTAWLLVIILMASGSAFAIRKGRLVGKVIDPDGNPIEGVTVTATSKEVPGGFNVRDVRSFDAIHDRYAYVRCRRGKHYLLTMANACLGLQDSIEVAVANDFNRVCSHDGAWLTYRDFERTRRCIILRVEAFARSSHRVSWRGRRRVVRCWVFREMGDAGVVALR